jgi:hypothetical protein
MEIEMTPITVVARCFTGYKYLIRLALITIFQFFFLSRLGFTFLSLCSQSMEDKRGTKRVRSPSKKGSPSPDGAKTPLLATSGSPPPLMSRQRSPDTAPAHRCGSKGDPLGRFQWWIFLHLLMKEISSLMSHGMRSSLEGFLATSTATS